MTKGSVLLVRQTVAQKLWTLPGSTVRGMNLFSARRSNERLLLLGRNRDCAVASAALAAWMALA
ncbi:MAG TPA: hypothetical protein VHS80_02535 [Chthoniobacterales bacterium]|nr:hypothetical protein [Chthoniobacterales bacterium]